MTQSHSNASQSGAFGTHDDPHHGGPDSDETSRKVAALIERLLSVGFDGRGRFESAAQVAEGARRRRSDPERAVDDLVAAHVRLAATSGFVTGVGGFVVATVAMPANVAGFYVIATRMAAGIAKIRGYDIDQPSVRTAVLLSLVGSDADDILAKMGSYTGARPGTLSELATNRLPGTAVVAINKAVGFRLLTQFGRKALSRLGRAVPFVGGAVGAGLDGYLLNQIAGHVRREFPPVLAGELGDGPDTPVEGVVVTE